MEDACNKRSNARRNLNKSFNDSESIGSPVQNYSIINTDDEDSLLLKLRKSTKNPCVILDRSDDKIFADLPKQQCIDENKVKDCKDEFEDISPNKGLSEVRKSFQSKLEINEDTPKVYTEKLSIKKLQPAPDKKIITLSTNEKVLRRSSRKVERVSYVDFHSPTKTPKRNRKVSTSSDSSTSIGVQQLSPSKRANLRTPNKSKLKACSDKLNNTPIRGHRGKSENLNDNNNEKKVSSSSLHRPDLVNFNNDRLSAPLDAFKADTPNGVKPKRNVRTPKRYQDSYDLSPLKTKRTSKRSYEDWRSSDEESISKVDISPVKSCFVNLETCSVQKENFGRRSVLRTNNLNTPKKYVHYKKQAIEENTPQKGIIMNEEHIEVRTPYKNTNTENNKTPKSAMKNTPSSRARLIREGTITPSVQSRGTPIQTNLTPLNKARVKLHVSYIPKVLACREKEYDDIYNFLEGKLLDGCGGCMYVSGVPGTGKTATVTDVIRKLEDKSKKAVLPIFQFVSINGMKLSEPRQSYVEILKQLDGKTLSWEQAQLTLDNRFTKHKKTCSPIILLIDELDILCTKRQDVVYNLLDWPTKASAQLIVVTIANTMDLPERLLMGRVTSRLGLTRLTFQAYTHKQLQEIVTMRLMGTKVFNPDAVQLVARKVASVSGDARRALDICRRAAEIAELEGPNTLVSMDHVNEALNAMITQPKVKAIKYCSRLQQLILQAIVAEVERTGVEETTFSDVYTMLQSVVSIDGFQMVSYTLAMTAVSKLGACRLLLTDQKFNDFHQKLILNVSADDVYYALRKE